MGWFSSCEHEWVFSWQESTKKRNSCDKHKCTKCGKVEDCDFSEYCWGTVYRCPKCHHNNDWD